MPLRSGFKRTRPNLLRRSQPSKGPAIVQAEAVLGVHRLTWPQHFTTAQRDILELFLFSTCRSGALRFALPNPDGGAALECRVVPISETDLYEEELVQAKGYWAITLTLEVLP